MRRPRRDLLTAVTSAATISPVDDQARPTTRGRAEGGDEGEGEERSVLPSAFPSPRPIYLRPRPLAFPTAADACAEATRPRIRTARRDRLTTPRKIARCEIFARAALYGACRLRKARMCDIHEGSVEEKSDMLNAGRGSREKGGCWWDISAARERVFQAR